MAGLFFLLGAALLLTGGYVVFASLGAYSDGARLGLTTNFEVIMGLILACGGLSCLGTAAILEVLDKKFSALMQDPPNGGEPPSS